MVTILSATSAIAKNDHNSCSATAGMIAVSGSSL